MRLNNSSSEKKIIKSPKDNFKEFHNREMVKFLFYDETSLDFDKNLIISMSPTILDNIPKCNQYYIIRAPYGISKDDFSTFLYIYSNISYHTGPQIGSNSKKLFSILKLMDFFNNEKFNIQIITNIIIPELNPNIAIDLIIFSYDKLCYFSERGKEADNAYFELFYQALEELSKNEILIIKNIDKLKSLDGKIIEELIQKTFRNLIFGKYLIEKDEDSVINNSNSRNDHIHSDINQMNYFEENEVESGDYNKKKKIEEAKTNNNDNIKIINIKNLKNLINFLMKINNLDNIFSLLTKEYMSLLSSESISELQSMPNPSFQVKIPVAIYENYYEEFPLDININNQLLTLVIFYKIGDKSINACIKLSNKKHEKNKNKENQTNSKYTFEILTFLTNVLVEKDKKILTMQSNLTSLTNNKSMYSILKIPHFNSEIKSSDITTNTSNRYNENTNSIKINNEKSMDYFLITVQIKLCYIYSIVSSYLLQDFNNYVNDKNISKLSKQLFILLIKNQKLNKKNENNLIKSILLWLDDEINIKEDISEIFYLIKWEEIDDDLIFELLIKYSHIILNDDSLENFFLDIYLNKFGQNKIVESTILKLFKAIKKIEYHKLFGQIKKNEKIIENLKTQKFQKDINIKELILNNKKNKNNEIEIEKKYNNNYTQTEPNICLNYENGNDSQNFDEIKEKENLKKQDVFWNFTKIKNFMKDKNMSKNIKSNSLNDIMKKNKPLKSEKNKTEIPKPKYKSNKISTTNIEKYKNKSNENNKNVNKNINKNKSKEIINIKDKNKDKEKYIIKRSKSNKALNNNKKNKKESHNISVMKKQEGKIKEMLIFPYNFSAIKKFQNNINKTNIKLNYKIFNKNNKSNRCIRNNINLSNRQITFENNNYNTGRNKEIVNSLDNKNNSSSRAFSENRKIINLGIIKEICFMNNNFYN